MTIEKECELDIFEDFLQGSPQKGRKTQWPEAALRAAVAQPQSDLSVAHEKPRDPAGQRWVVSCFMARTTPNEVPGGYLENVVSSTKTSLTLMPAYPGCRGVPYFILEASLQLPGPASVRSKWRLIIAVRVPRISAALLAQLNSRRNGARSRTCGRRHLGVDFCSLEGRCAQSYRGAASH
jgi:hypothetical protein